MTCVVCKSASPSLWGTKRGYQLYRCAECALIFVHPIPQTAGDIYNKEYFEGASGGFGYANYDEDKEPMIPVFEKYIDLIKAKLGGKGRLLDVGAATGFFVELAQKAGFDAEGIEISDHAAAAGRSKGRKVQTGVLSDVQSTFDCITMLDVIEHVPAPHEEIAKAASLLRSGGVLVINTPDMGSLLARTLKTKWHHMGPPEHLYYFNRSNMGRLLSDNGFSVEEDTTIGKSFTFKYVFKTINRWTKLSVFSHLAQIFSRPGLSRFSIPINLGDNMFILARKR